MSPLEALEAIDGDAPVREPPASPTVGLDPGHSRDLRDYVEDIIREAFNEGHTRGLWEAALHARAALKAAP